MSTVTEEPQPATSNLAALAARLPRAASASPRQLRALVEAVGREPGLWADAVRHEEAHRHYRRIWLDERVDLWVNTWPDGSETALHDHGGSSGAYHVVSGVLTEDWVQGHAGDRRLRRRLLTAGTTSAFGADHVHDVGSRDGSPAVSIHAYSPPLTTELLPARRRRAHRDERQDDHRGVVVVTSTSRVPIRTGPARPLTVDAMLETARGRIRRLDPPAAAAAIAAGALLVDIRPAAQRAAEGEFPRALVVERNVLEWRFDPTSAARLPCVRDHDLEVVVACSEGYTSSLAAAALVDLGLWRTADVAGGFRAWRAAGLPTR